MRTPDLHSEWAQLLVGALADAGVREAVISPGSRSTPLAVAAVRHPRIRAHAVIDERCAAFFALGQARVTGQPTAVICTSGSAAAHFYPAVIEAALANVPILLVTADRPPELHGRGANQAIDQAHLFGTYCRLFLDLGVPDPDPRALRGVRGAGSRVVAATRSPVPGPVHVNAPFRKPLEPESTGDAALRETARAIAAEPTPRIGPVIPTPDPSILDELADRCRRAESGIVVAGPAPLRRTRDRAAIAEFCRRTGFVLLAESTSQARFCAETAEVARCDRFDLALRDPRTRAACRPELVIRLDATPVSRGWEQLRDELPPGAAWYLADYEAPDPGNCAGGLVAGDVGAAVRGLVDRLPADEPGTGDFADRLAAIDQRIDAIVDEALAADTSDAGDGFVAEPLAVRGVLESVPAGSLVAVGNSLPVREIDWVCPGRIARADFLCQRGASGIDGNLSAAVGASTVSDRPVTLVTGDLAFLHDIHGLLTARDREQPLTVAVINNRGGRIFSQLPVAADPGLEHVVRRFFVSEYVMDFYGIAKGFGIDYARVARANDLGDALADAHQRHRCTLLEIAVEPESSTAFVAQTSERIAAETRGTPA